MACADPLVGAARRARVGPAIARGEGRQRQAQQVEHLYRCLGERIAQPRPGLQSDQRGTDFIAHLEDMA
jgi:hypothetical protein